jgi:hypothetical protein
VTHDNVITTIEMIPDTFRESKNKILNDLEEMLDCQSMKNSFYNKKFYLARI